MKLLIYSIYFILMNFLPCVLFADNLQIIKENAQKYNCTPLGDVKDQPRYLARINSWSVTLEYEENSSTMFWCKNPGSQRDFKIVVVSQDKKHPWAQCPSTIEVLGGFSPLNLSLRGISVSGEYDSGGYLFTCKEGAWDIKISD